MKALHIALLATAAFFGNVALAQEEPTIQNSVSDDTHAEADSAESDNFDSLIERAILARNRGGLDGLREALRLYELMHDSGDTRPATKVHITVLRRQIELRKNREREAEAAAKLGGGIMSRLASSTDAVKSETWKLTTDSFTRPLCAKLRRSGGMPALLAGNAATLYVKNDGCEYFSIMAGSFRIAVGQVEPGTCDAAGCDVTLRIGCRSKGAPLLAFCSDFYSNHPQYLSARLELDETSETGFRLRIP